MVRRAPELIVFDCDGVLVDSEVLAVGALLEVLQNAGVPATQQMIGRCFGMKQSDILDHVAQETGVAVPPSVPDEVWPATKRWFSRDLKAMPGIVEALEALGGVPRCVASSSSQERIRFSLELTGLRRFFGEDIFSSQQVARGKPAPDLFLFAAERMAVKPELALVFEDSVFGVGGARAAGMRTIGFLGGSHIEAGHRERLLQHGADACEPDWPSAVRHLLPEQMS